MNFCANLHFFYEFLSPCTTFLIYNRRICTGNASYSKSGQPRLLAIRLYWPFGSISLLALQVGIDLLCRLEAGRNGADDKRSSVGCIAADKDILRVLRMLGLQEAHCQ